MAIDSYMAFQQYGGAGAAGAWLVAESQVDLSKNKEDLAAKTTPIPGPGALFEVKEYSFDVEQTLNIGSQSSGAGAGKVTFNPFSITRSIDKASPTFYQMACSGTAFCNAVLMLRKSLGSGASMNETSGGVFLRFDFKLVAVKTIAWAHDEESPSETITFEYGGLQMRYAQQDPSGALGKIFPGGWNRVRNVADLSPDPIKQV